MLKTFEEFLEESKSGDDLIKLFKDPSKAGSASKGSKKEEGVKIIELFK